MALHHYLGSLSKIGETRWYVTAWGEQWVAFLSISAAALKCGIRDRWIGWDFTSQYGRLKLVANNRRFLILQRVAPQQCRFTCAVLDATPLGERLVGTLWPPCTTARNLCGP